MIRRLLGPIYFLALRMRIWVLGGVRAFPFLRKTLRLPRNGLVLARDASDAQLLVEIPGESYERDYPVFISEGLKRFYEGREVCKVGVSRALEYRNARVWGNYGGCVIDSADGLVLEHARDIWTSRNHTAFRRLRLPSLRRLPGRTLLLGTPEVESNYWHWLLDLLPKLWLLEQEGIGLSEFDHILLNWKKRPYQTETLEILGLDESKVVALDGEVHVSCESVVAVHLKTHLHEIRRATTQWIRARFSGVGERHPDFGERIYVSRSNCAIRQVENEDEVLAILEELGFRKILPDEYSFREQIGIFANAKFVVAPHGAALTNMLFCNEGTTLLEIFCPEYVDLGYWAILHGLGFDRRVMYGEERVIEPSEYRHDRKADVYIDTVAMTNALSQLGLCLGN